MTGDARNNAHAGFNLPSNQQITKSKDNTFETVDQVEFIK